MFATGQYLWSRTEGRLRHVAERDGGRPVGASQYLGSLLPPWAAPPGDRGYEDTQATKPCGLGLYVECRGASIARGKERTNNRLS